MASRSNGLRAVKGVKMGSTRTPKLSHSRSAGSSRVRQAALPMPKQKAVKLPKAAANTGIAGTTHTRHAAQVKVAMGSSHVPRPRGNGVPGVPVGNPAPGPANAFE